MATEYMDHIKSGLIAGYAEYFRADAASTPLWAPVVLAAAASGYDLPEVATTNTAHDPMVIGVAVGPLADAANSYCNINAGDMVSVCILGICKVKVDGNATTIADGDGLSAHATGYAQKCDVLIPATYLKATIETAIKHLGSVFAMALEAATADGDIIPCFVRGALGTVT
jgi:hypothetical protein